MQSVDTVEKSVKGNWPLTILLLSLILILTMLLTLIQGVLPNDTENANSPPQDLFFDNDANDNNDNLSDVK